MSLFSKLLAKKKFHINDDNLGECQSIFSQGGIFHWRTKTKLMNQEVELCIEGTKESISQSLKDVLNSMQNNQTEIQREAESALRSQYKEADIEFNNLNTEFNFVSITIKENEHYLTYEEKKRPFYHFNIFFKNNKQTGVSIDS